jgi:hypothetical protein
MPTREMDDAMDGGLYKTIACFGCLPSPLLVWPRCMIWYSLPVRQVLRNTLVFDSVFDGRSKKKKSIRLTD